MTKRFRAAVSQLNTDPDGHTRPQTAMTRRRLVGAATLALVFAAAGHWMGAPPVSAAGQRGSRHAEVLQELFHHGRLRCSRRKSVAKGRQRKSHRQHSQAGRARRRAGKRRHSSRRSCTCRRRKRSRAPASTTRSSTTSAWGRSELRVRSSRARERSLWRSRAGTRQWPPVGAPHSRPSDGSSHTAPTFSDSCRSIRQREAELEQNPSSRGAGFRNAFRRR